MKNKNHLRVSAKTYVFGVPKNQRFFAIMNPAANKRKRGIEVSFAWLFAIIVGVVILFLAIYGATRTIRLGQYKISVETEKEIGILFNPLEIGFETAKVTSFSLPTETRIYNECDEEGIFGEQIIGVSQKSFGRWPEPAEGASFKNKYIFSENVTEGKKFYVFSKPFEFPFKVADLIFLIPESEKYCFMNNVPDEIKDEIDDLNQKNLLTEEDEECVNANTKVCFSFEDDCNIIVDYYESGGRVKKDGEKMDFEGDALMYAGVFSDKEIYECQLKRLMQRLEQLALLYDNKASFVAGKCPSNLNLLELSNDAARFEDSSDLDSISSLVNDIKDKNEDAYCKLW